jgi:hypothetical protein
VTFLAHLIVAVCELFQPDLRAANRTTGTVVALYAVAPCTLVVESAGRRLIFPQVCTNLDDRQRGRRVSLERRHPWSRWELAGFYPPYPEGGPLPWSLAQ